MIRVSLTLASHDPVPLKGRGGKEIQFTGYLLQAVQAYNPWDKETY